MSTYIQLYSRPACIIDAAESKRHADYSTEGTPIKNRIIGAFQESNFVLRWPDITGQLTVLFFIKQTHIYLIILSHFFISSSSVS